MSFRKILGLCVFFILGSYLAIPQEKSVELFNELFEKYKNTEFESITLDNQHSEGSGMIVFDTNKILSKDLFCEISLLSSSGQTRYFVYKKDGEDIWFFNKRAIFYEIPFELENAEIINTYFKYMNELPYVFNDSTGKYDIQADTYNYQAIRDVRSLAQLINIIQNNIKK